MNAWRIKFRDLREAVNAVLAQLPAEPNTVSWGFGKERGQKFYLRRLSVESIEELRKKADLDELETIELTKRDAEALVKIVTEDPPEPNEVLKKAAEDYKESQAEQESTGEYFRRFHPGLGAGEGRD